MPRLPLIDARPVWIEPEKIPSRGAIRDLDSNPLVASILYRRGVRSVAESHAFLHPEQQPLPSPSDIPHMDLAVDRLQRAIEREETIGIFGDYDTDGITSTTIMAGALRASLTADQVITRLPQRSEGYGLNRAAIDEFRASGVSLLIALDCASTDHVQTAHVLDEGMDLIIVDHHHMNGPGPQGAITVSPQLGPNDALKDLTAAGVTWLVVSALAQRGHDVSPTYGTDSSAYLDLVALGTVADVAPLNGVNRGLVARGLQIMRHGTRAGLNALMEVAGLTRPEVRATDIAFSLAPRINAPGRLDSPDVALDLLLAPDISAARPLAREVEDANRRRKARGAQIHEEAWLALCQHPDWERRQVFAAGSTRWEPGLVGAVASRLAEETRRPVILFHEENGRMHGSGRSVAGFNLLASLEQAAPLLTRFGGHSLAAGVALESRYLADLEAHLSADLAAQGLTVPVPPQIAIDATLPPEYLTLATPRELQRLEPFGRGNEDPMLQVKEVELLRYDAMGSDRSHLKLTCRATGRQFEAIGWGMAWRSKELVGVRRVSLVGRLSVNSWNGRDRLQMVVEDFRAA